jgi:mannose-1-phosphate guanylyltransferase
VQPANKGNAPAILYSLLRIAGNDPDAAVAFFPSDHFFSDDAAFMANVDAAFAAVELLEGSVVLLGIEPEKAETSYGWIKPVNSLFGGLPSSVSGVKRFWEKPQARDARRLLTSGGLWNSFVMIGKIESFFELFREHLPVMFRMFTVALSTPGARHGVAALRSLYEWIDETNFSSRVLEKAADRLFVKRVAGVGWSDLGEPQRVMGTLAALGVKPAWMRTAAAA